MIKYSFKKAAAIGMCCTMISSGAVSAMPRALYENRIIRENKGIGIQINGQLAELDVEPFIENNRTLIPLRGVMEKLGAKVEWHADSGSIEIITKDVSIQLVVGRDTVKIIRSTDGVLKEETLQLEVPPKIMAGRTFIPGRFVTETLGAKVAWDNAFRLMIIETDSQSDIISVERPVDFEIIKPEVFEKNELLTEWYEENFKTEGIHSLKDGDWRYVLVSAGEKLTGGYDLQIDSITEVTPGTAYVHAILSSPDKEDFVTQALTYPNALVRFHKGNIEKIQGDMVEY